MDLDLTGKTALVTGSTRGIGLATAIGLAQMGAEVIVNGREQGGGRRGRWQRSGRPRRRPRCTRRRSISAMRRAAPRWSTQFPDVDILVNNLGIYEPKGFFDIEDADWTKMFEVNVMSGVRLTRHYLKRMLDNKDWGRVVFVSSESGVFIPKEMVHYGFSKSAQLVIARGAAETTKGTNVTVNSVMPGPTWVEMAPVASGRARRGCRNDRRRSRPRTFTERRPASLLQRYAKPEEVANLICYVCSKASSATNGAALRVDGGIVTNPF